MTDTASTPEPPPLVVSSRLHIAVAIAVSTVLHGALGWAVHDMSLLGDDEGFEPERIFQVRRTRVDLHAGPRPDHETDEAEAPSELNDLSRALLEGASGTEAREVGPAPDPAFGEASDERAFDLGKAPGVSLPESQGEKTVVSRLMGTLTLDVPYVEGGEEVSDRPSRRGPGTMASSAGSMLVDESLDETGLVSTGPPEPLVPAPPAMRDTFIDVRQRGAVVKPAPLDFGRILIDRAAQMKGPEYLDDDFDYALYVYEPRKRWSDRKEDQRGYFRVEITGRRSLRKLRAMPKDIIFVIDTSGSVSQAWVDAVMSGVADALLSLNERDDPQKSDRFNIVLFKESARFLSRKSIQPVNARTLAQARAFLKGNRAGGYTDVNQALSRLLQRDVGVERVHELILISDGRPTRGVQDTRELINLITRDNDLAASIYCVGIGNRQNRPLLEFLAYRNRGFCAFASSSRQAAGVIRDLVSRLRYPLIKGVALNVGLEGVHDVFPQNVPNVHQGETFSIYGRFDQPKMLNLQVSGMNHDREVAFSFSRPLAQAKRGEASIASNWAFWKLHHLYSEQIRRGRSRELDRQILWLKRRYKLKSIE
ncbi:MAG: hypothetical protein CMJ18_11180 [Phycisphaeraceae bacterium]|nr:hypothetical protein [Phycisphaeraceae bacterium]